MRTSCGIDIPTRLSSLSISLIIVGAIIFVAIIILIIWIIKRKRNKIPISNEYSPTSEEYPLTKDVCNKPD